MQKNLPESDVSSVPRRKFLGQVATAGVSGGLGFLGVFGSVPELTAATFQPHVGSRFCIRGAKDGPLIVQLAEASAQPYDPNRPAHVRRAPFILIFRATGTQFENQNCKISHPRLGTIEAFLSRVDMPKQGMNLQAVFG